jgi:hypothetical protein
MKSETLAGVSLIARWISKQHSHTWEWWSMSGVILTLTIVGVSGIISAGNSRTMKTTGVWVAAIIVGDAFQISWKGYFVQKKHSHPIMISVTHYTGERLEVSQSHLT